MLGQVVGKRPGDRRAGLIEVVTDLGHVELGAVVGRAEDVVMQALAHDAVEGGDLGARWPLVAIRPPGDLPHEPAQIAKGGQRLA